jgi:hypothetical protein
VNALGMGNIYASVCTYMFVHGHVAHMFTCALRVCERGVMCMGVSVLPQGEHRGRTN